MKKLLLSLLCIAMLIAAAPAMVFAEEGNESPTMPEAPASAAIVATEEGFTISWAAGAGAKSYEVQYGKKSSFSGATTVTVTGTSLSLAADYGTTYYARVRSVNGEFTSSWTNAGSATLKATPAVIEAPTRNDDITYTITWTANPLATGYDIYAGSSKSNMMLVASVGPDVTTYTLKGTLGKTNYYKVVAKFLVNGEEYTSASKTGKIKLTADAPKAKSEKDVENVSITITWTPSPFAQKYAIYRSEGHGFSKIAEVAADVFSYTDTTIKANVKYSYKVVAITANNNEIESKSVKQTIAFKGGSTTAKGAVGSVALTWKPVLGATEYRIFLASSKAGYYSMVSSTTGTATTLSLEPGKYYVKVVAVKTVGAREILSTAAIKAVTVK